MLTLVGRGSELDVRLLIPQAGKALGRGSGKDGQPTITDLIREGIRDGVTSFPGCFTKVVTDKRQHYDVIRLEESDKDDLWNLGSVTRSRTIP